MANAQILKAQREQALEATRSGPPARTSNPFFGVGPITDATADEGAARLLRFEFDAWLEKNYRKLDDRGLDLGPFTTAEIGRSMHRGYPADKFLIDMMREIHRYFEFPKTNRMAVGLGGGHSGFTVCALHMVTAHDPAQHVYVDTLRPESEAAKGGGFFRQSWGAQLIEMHRHARNGDESRLHFASEEGAIPSADALEKMGVKLFIGVGHETTGATTYTATDIAHLLEWIDRNPAEHHAVLDATSMLGAMPWGEATAAAVTAKCCMFMPFQKAIGGISGYFVVSFTPQALALVEANQKNPSWAIPRQLKIVAPVDPKLPLTGERTVNVGPIYDPQQDKMLGGVINTYSTLAFAETTFGLLRSEQRLGSLSDLYKRSLANRKAVDDWLARNPLFEAGVSDPEKRGAAVTLLRVKDSDITDPDIHTKIIARSKQLLGYEGLTHPNGEHEPGLDVARYVNAFPGTPGDYRAWIGGIRPHSDIAALLDNLKYAYLRAKIVVLEEELAKTGDTFQPQAASAQLRSRRDDPQRAYKVLIADLVGMRLDADGKPDHSEVRRHIEAKGGVFHEGGLTQATGLEKGRIHFFYQPDLSTEAEILPLTDKGQYDAVIAAATFLPKGSVFPLGGVRIGAGTGNMGSASWGGGSGAGGTAPLMNTPGFNSRATAQMAFKALLKVAPDLPVAEMHQRVVAGDFDTGRHLRDFPTAKLEGRRMAIIGYGNIGREMARLASAFGMDVIIHARPRHRAWIESEGFLYAASAEEAARKADVLSVHTGLGPLGADGRYANQSLVSTSILDALADGAILINYDRGEVVDAEALDAAMAKGKVAHAAIDADLFCDAAGTLSGPMVPYRALHARYAGRLELLPHAAADTDHPSRVAGAMQAVDQIFDTIQFGVVTNLKGDLPEGYIHGGSRSAAGVGAVSAATLCTIAADADAVTQLRQASETLAALWGALSSTTDTRQRATLVERHGAALVKATNHYSALAEKLGLTGPYNA